MNATTAQNGSVRQILENTESGRPMHSSSAGETQPRRSFGLLLNRPHWLATGVINDLPPRQDPLQMVQQVPPRENALGTSLKAELGAQQKLTDQLDKGQAADLALREVLHTVMEAKYVSAPTPLPLARVLLTFGSTKGLFQNIFGGCNPFELDFPSLCLRILPPPSTLFSAHPFPTTESWTLNPPDQTQYDALQSRIRDRISLFRQQKSHIPPTRRASHPSPTSTSLVSDSEADRLLNHVFQAWQHWSSLDEPTRQKTWTLCILRSYTQAESARKEAESTIDVLRRQIEHLSMQLAKASNDYSLYRDNGVPSSAILTSMRLSPETLVQIHKQGTDMRNWDYDKLVDKWRGIVREERESGYKIGRAMSEAEARREWDPNGSEMRGASERSESLMNGDEARRNGGVDPRIDDEVLDDGDEAEGSVGDEFRGSRGHQERTLSWPTPSGQGNGLGNNVHDHAMEGT